MENGHSSSITFPLHLQRNGYMNGATTDRENVTVKGSAQENDVTFSKTVSFQPHWSPAMNPLNSCSMHSGTKSQASASDYQIHAVASPNDNVANLRPSYSEFDHLRLHAISITEQNPAKLTTDYTTKIEAVKALTVYAESKRHIETPTVHRQCCCESVQHVIHLQKNSRSQSDTPNPYLNVTPIRLLHPGLPKKPQLDRSKLRLHLSPVYNGTLKKSVTADSTTMSGKLFPKSHSTSLARVEELSNNDEIFATSSQLYQRKYTTVDRNLANAASHSIGANRRLAQQTVPQVVSVSLLNRPPPWPLATSAAPQYQCPLPVTNSTWDRFVARKQRYEEQQERKRFMQQQQEFCRNMPNGDLYMHRSVTEANQFAHEPVWYNANQASRLRTSECHCTSLASNAQHYGQSTVIRHNAASAPVWTPRGFNSFSSEFCNQLDTVDPSTATAYYCERHRYAQSAQTPEIYRTTDQCHPTITKRAPYTNAEYVQVQPVFNFRPRQINRRAESLDSSQSIKKCYVKVDRDELLV